MTVPEIIARIAWGEEDAARLAARYGADMSRFGLSMAGERLIATAFIRAGISGLAAIVKMRGSGKDEGGELSLAEEMLSDAVDILCDFNHAEERCPMTPPDS